MIRNSLLILAAFGILLISCGDQGSYDNLKDGNGAALPPAATALSQGKLSPGDVLAFSFPNNQEFDQSQKIAPNGRITLPMIGELSASGKTVANLQKTLVSRYRAKLQNPNVVVTLKETSSTVYVSGYVLRPGKIPLLRQMTALEAVMEAGGFSKLGSPKRVSVLRNQNGNYRRYRLNLEAALQGQANPFIVQPNDVIYVR